LTASDTFLSLHRSAFWFP